MGIESRCIGHRTKHPEGKRFGSLVAVKEERNESGYAGWECLCDCGNVCFSATSSLIFGKQGCWECRNKTISQKKWRGYGEISGEFWSRIKKHAMTREYDFEISIEQGWDLFLEQKRKCALSGVELMFYRGRADRGKITASLDRIDSSKGYMMDNVQWVHKKINILKMDWPQEEFIEWCRKVADYVVTGITQEKIN